MVKHIHCSGQAALHGDACATSAHLCACAYGGKLHPVYYQQLRNNKAAHKEHIALHMQIYTLLCFPTEYIAGQTEPQIARQTLSSVLQ